MMPSQDSWLTRVSLQWHLTYVVSAHTGKPSGQSNWTSTVVCALLIWWSMLSRLIIQESRYSFSANQWEAQSRCNSLPSIHNLWTASLPQYPLVAASNKNEQL